MNSQSLFALALLLHLERFSTKHTQCNAQSTSFFKKKQVVLQSDLKLEKNGYN